MDSKTKVYDFIKGNLINFIVILISIAYLFYGMISIENTDLTIEEQIAKAGIGIIIGLLIKQGVGENGFNKGYNSKAWFESMEKYSNACNLANPYLERVDNFYRYEEIEKKREYRRMILMANQMKYEWFFDYKGNYIDNKEQYDKLDRKQLRALRKAIKIKIYNLNLFSEYSNEVEFNIKKEVTDKNQRAKMFGKNGVAQIGGAIIGAYFLPMWNGWNWGAFIVATIQVALWVFCGVIQLYTNYNYVVIEKTNKLARKKELLVKFRNGCEKGLYENNPYEEELDGEERVYNKIVAIPDVLNNSTDSVCGD